MRPTDVVRAIVYPLTESTVLIPLLVFWLLVSLALWAGLFGLILLFIVIPAVFRYQMIVLEARARGVTPATPDLALFNWFGKLWTLFPLFVALLLTWAIVAAAYYWGTAWAILLVLFASVFFPASVAVLAITHSPLQSLSPPALLRLWKRCAGTFWIATVFLLVASWLSAEAGSLPATLAGLVQLFLSFAFFSLVGSLIEPYGLIEDIEIPVAPDKRRDAIVRDLESTRTAVLNHAYGFISRDNRSGGFKHVFDSIETDPDPVAAWAWYFEQMLRWEDQRPAMFFAQHYLHDQLRHGEQGPAVKLMMRCRLVDERFRPLPGDMAAATAAADACGNAELVAVLSQN